MPSAASRTTTCVHSPPTSLTCLLKPSTLRRGRGAGLLTPAPQGRVGGCPVLLGSVLGFYYSACSLFLYLSLTFFFWSFLFQGWVFRTYNCVGFLSLIRACLSSRGISQAGPTRGAPRGHCCWSHLEAPPLFLALPKCQFLSIPCLPQSHYFAGGEMCNSCIEITVSSSTERSFPRGYTTVG